MRPGLNPGFIKAEKRLLTGRPGKGSLKMPREIKEEVILEVFRNEDERGGIISLRVVSWNKGTPKLEKRSFWTTLEGEVRTGKIVGITEEEFNLLIENKDKIQKAFKEGEVTSG